MQSQETAPIFNADAERMLLAKYLSAEQLALIADERFEFEEQDGQKSQLAQVVHAYHSDWLARTYVSPSGMKIPRAANFEADYARWVAAIDAAITKQTGVSQPLGGALVKVLLADMVRRLREGMEPVPEEPLIDVKAYAAYIIRDFYSRREEIEALIVAEIEQMRLSGEPEDELWTVRSRFVGPLAGYRGYGLVRDGRVTKHKVIIRY